jgi:hydroxymethylpyrimidine/phosphomethylpyrimidine kinase
MEFPNLILAPPKALTVAGSDSGGGAGIQADLKTFAAFGVYGTSALTAVTAQNTRGVFAVAEVPEEVIALQIDVVLEDIGADAVKSGMLSSASIVETVADRLEAWGVDHFVVDPVMVAKGGHPLLHESAVAALKERLLPLASVVTPNIPEAEILSGMSIDSDEAAREAARAIAALGPRYVIVKGGHRSGDATDLVFDGSEFTELTAERIDTPNTHGTGCS